MKDYWGEISLEELEDITIFNGVDFHSISSIIENINIISLEKESVLILQGETVRKLFIILEGSLSILFTPQDSREINSNIILEKGETVGELSIIDHKPASATVIANRYCRVMEITEEAFWSLITLSHQFATNVLILLSHRMRNENELLEANILEKISFQEQTNIDPLTNLYNRRWLSIQLPRLIKRSAISNEPLSVLMIDIDHFKQINDNYGHLTGDKVLKFLSNTIKGNIRPEDYACRYGGEEFIIIFPKTGAKEALIPAERIRTITEKESEVSELPTITISGGLATINNNSSEFDWEELVKIADNNLYFSKDNGRNRITPQ